LNLMYEDAELTATGSPSFIEVSINFLIRFMVKAYPLSPGQQNRH
jgi:hypothetical protein